ncbi:MAG: class I SAM-dependent methyltransferase [Rhodospirillaceae bacterium]|nr:class I SAM-dependent methyltransferase [Rhodospirillaceae bacterium]
MTELREHWERAYKTKAETAVSWFQPRLVKSLQLIRDAAPDIRASVIDIGGGASTLPDSLLKAGYADVTVLDISEASLARSQERLGAEAVRVNWLVADITTWSPSRTWDVWHDRAVFHFLTDVKAQDHYIAALRQGTLPGSTAIMSTFALDGPERCSGLPVQRYSPTALAERIGAPFVLMGQHAEHHVTPSGTIQSFIYVVLKHQ